MPKISIIIPCYNVEKFLPRCLDSVLAQTFSNFEAICVNDGSPDNALQILEEYARKDARIKVINQNNYGLSVARNNGIKKANGEYIYIMDSDDYIHPQTLELLYNNVFDADFVACDFIETPMDSKVYFEKIDGSKIKKEIFTDLKNLYIETKIIGKLRSVVWNKLYKKEIFNIIKFAEGIFPTEDDIFVFELMMRAQKTIKINVPLYYYVENPSSVMRGNILTRLEKTKKGAIYFFNLINKYVCDNKTNLTKKEKSRLEQKAQTILFKSYIKNYKKIDTKALIQNLYELRNIKDFNPYKLRIQHLLTFLFLIIKDKI